MYQSLEIQMQCSRRTVLSGTTHWAFDIREYEHRNN